jgi:hypothetical protein
MKSLSRGKWGEEPKTTDEGRHEQENARSDYARAELGSAYSRP